MGDSTGSRYGIVANLTEKKLQLMDEQTLLDNQLQEAEQDYNIALANAKADKEFINNEAKKRCDSVDRQVREKKDRVEVMKANKTRRSKSNADKIAAVDQALKNIQEISKDSASP